MSKQAAISPVDSVRGALHNALRVSLEHEDELQEHIHSLYNDYERGLNDLETFFAVLKSVITLYENVVDTVRF